MDNNLILTFIKEIELFKGLTERDFDVLVESIVEKNYKKGDLLFEEHGPRKDIFIIYKGEVELFKSIHFGAEKKLSYFSKGDFLGEGSWTDDSPHSTSARASQDTVFVWR